MLRAAALATRGVDALREISMAKLFASETYVKVANAGMQVLGAYGYNVEFDMRRHFRDAALRLSAPEPRRSSAPDRRADGPQSAVAGYKLERGVAASHFAAQAAISGLDGTCEQNIQLPSGPGFRLPGLFRDPVYAPPEQSLMPPMPMPPPPGE